MMDTKITNVFGSVEFTQESFDASQFIELLDTLRPAKLHQVAELLERDTKA